MEQQSRKNFENRDYHPVTSSTKSWLIGIWIFLIACDILRFCVSLVPVSGSGIVTSLDSPILNSVMLTATIKQWKAVLAIGRTVLIIVIVLGFIIAVNGGIAISSTPFTKTQRTLAIFREVVLSIMLLLDGVLVMLLGRYTKELENPSSA